MRFIDKVDIQAQEIHQTFEFGDLTIFIGRSNCGKSRILRQIVERLNNISGKFSPASSTFYEACKKFGVIPLPEVKENISSYLLPSYRQPKGNMVGLSTSVARCAQSVTKIDPTISDLGSNEIERKSGERRPLGEQGSGVHNMAHVFEALNNKVNLVLIDEPEVSQFPYGKIELLNAMLEQSTQKQIIIATHDPTLINQFLIRKSIEKMKVKPNILIYSFCGKQFVKVDLSNCDPEIHVGYLSQTYSGKPVHLILEGQTEFYAFQALLFRYAQYMKIRNYPKFINKIALSYMAGGQWKINLHHLPDPKHYDVLAVLDGEHKDDVDKAELGIDIKKIASVDECEVGHINWLCIDAKKIEDAFENIFAEVSDDKPIGLSLQIWSMSDEQIEKSLKDSTVTQQVFSIINWCLKRAGAGI